jgi:hypothetical protein
MRSTKGPPLKIKDVLILLMPSRMVQITASLGIPAAPTDQPEAVARRAGDAPVRPVLEQLNRGELQKLCDKRGVDRAGAIYDQDLIEKLLA